MPMNLTATRKKTLRAAALARRQALDAATREAAARAIAARADGLERTADAIISGYMPIRGELDPRPLMSMLAAGGATLAMPTIAAEGQPLIFRAWREGDEMRQGPLGIEEPLDSAAIVVPDILLVPLAAFDRRGHRIGYGAGHFDRALAALRLRKSVRAVGLAFAVQEIDAVPDEAHDVPLDLVLTEVDIIIPRSP
jgi:5-formyltetrahydrofolate cyclo-ligase